MRFTFLNDQRSILFAAVPVGIAAAVATTAFKQALEATGLLLFESRADVVMIFAGLALGWRVVIPTLGGALAGLLLGLSARIDRGRVDVADYMEAVASGTGRLPVRSTLLRSLSSFCSIVSGSSVGKEGAMIQLAALCGALYPSGCEDGDPNLQRMLTACGAAAGLASVYHTPLSAAVFVAEVVFGALAVQRLIPLFLASIAGAMVSQWHSGLEPLYPGLKVAIDLHWRLLLAAALMGVIAGASGALFLRAGNVAKRVFGRMPGGPVPRLALGGFGVGLLALVVPEVVGNGYHTIQSILQDRPLSMPVALVLAAKLAGTVLSMGSGAVGGVFTPSLFIGAALGQVLAPFVAGGNSLALSLIGMSSFLAATSQAPLVSVLMVFEMTLTPALLLPSMIGAVAAYYTAWGCQTSSLYSVVAARNQVLSASEAARTTKLTGLCDPTNTTIRPDATLTEANRRFTDAGTRYLYVVSSDGEMLGAVSIHAVHRALTSNPEATLTSLVEPDFPSLTLDSRLHDALALFSVNAVDRIPLIRDLQRRELLGTVSRKRAMLLVGRSRVDAAPGLP